MMTSSLALLTGLFIGAQHALEPDHLAAIGAMVPAEHSPRRAAAMGAWWGLGHSLSLMLVGAPLVLAGVAVPAALEQLAELAVAVMLVGMGARALWRARRVWRVGIAALDEAPRDAYRSTPVGMMHGLAGSGAAVVLATTSAPSSLTALGFLSLFGLGSVLGMAAAAALITAPASRMIDPQSRQRSWLLGLGGAASCAVGLFWGAPALLAMLTAM